MIDRSILISLWKHDAKIDNSYILEKKFYKFTFSKDYVEQKYVIFVSFQFERKLMRQTFLKWWLNILFNYNKLMLFENLVCYLVHLYSCHLENACSDYCWWTVINVSLFSLNKSSVFFYFKIIRRVNIKFLFNHSSLSCKFDSKTQLLVSENIYI